MRRPSVLKAVCAQPVRGFGCGLAWLLYVYDPRPSDLQQDVASLRRFPVVNLTEFLFELAASFGELDFSLLRVEGGRLHFQELVRES